MGKLSRAARLVSRVRDGLALLDDDERCKVIEILRSIMCDGYIGNGMQELPVDACVKCGSISIGCVLGMSKLAAEMWMTYVEIFVDQLGSEIPGCQLRNGVYRLTHSMCVLMLMLMLMPVLRSRVCSL